MLNRGKDVRKYILHIVLSKNKGSRKIKNLHSKVRNKENQWKKERKRKIIGKVGRTKLGKMEADVVIDK